LQQLTVDKLQSNAPSQKPLNQAVLLSSISIVVLLISYWGTLYEIVDMWIQSDTYRHGFIVFPVVIYLFWLNREKNNLITPELSKFALGLLITVVVLWIIGFASNLSVLRHLSFIAMIPIILWAYFGGQFIRNNIFPLSYLFFAVPIGEFMVPVLQDVTATITVYLLRLSNIPVVLEGRYFYIPGGSFEVAKACSGIRYLIASMAIGSIYAYLMYTSFWRRILFFLLAAFVPVIANGIRAYGIVMLAHYSNYEYAVGFDHLIYGWIFFGVVIFLLFWLGLFFREPINASEPCKNEVSVENKFLPKKENYFIFFMVISTLMIAPISQAWISERNNDDSYKMLTMPSLTDKGWFVVNDADVWQPYFIGATQEIRMAYSKHDRKVEVYLAFYKKQVQGKEMINAANRFYDKEKFFRKNEGNKNFEFNNGLNLSVITTELGARENSRIMYSWYLIGKTPTVNVLHAKLLEAKHILLNESKNSLVVAITTEVVKTNEDSSHTLDEFVVDFYPALLKSISSEYKN